MRVVLTLCIVVMLMSCQKIDSTNADAVVCRLSTLEMHMLPVTRGDMEDLCGEKGVKFKFDQMPYHQFVRLFETSPEVGTIDEYELRVLIIFADGKKLYIDHFGVVEWEGRVTRTFARDKLELVDGYMRTLVHADY